MNQIMTATQHTLVPKIHRKTVHTETTLAQRGIRTVQSESRATATASPCMCSCVCVCVWCWRGARRKEEDAVVQDFF
eukprot:m.1639434 g.1639434  ORF g.1639434 m.1639434 type:complete len:77 (+) comp35364_c0_seq1:214-444(+)